MIEVRGLSPADFVEALPAMRDVFQEALEYPPLEPRVMSFVPVARGHVGRTGFRAAAAFDGESLVGFTYGQLGEPGHWWREQVARALTPEGRRRWLEDAFELVELHVRPSHQGRGLGGRLHDLLLEGLSARSALLSTPAREGRAMLLYRSRGWEQLAEGHLFDGVSERYRILGLDLGRTGQGRSAPA